MVKHGIGMVGRGLPAFAGTRYQRGHGLGNMLRSITRLALPLVKRGAQTLGRQALNTAKQSAKNLGKQALHRAANAAVDVINAQNKKNPRRQPVRKIKPTPAPRKHKRKSSTKKKVSFNRTVKKTTRKDILG